MMESALDPAGPQAAHIYTLWLLMLGVCTVVLVSVTAAVLIVARRASRPPEMPPPDPAPGGEGRLRQAVSIALTISVALLALLFVATVMTERALARLPSDDAVQIKLTGHQWWWEATYEDAQASNVLTTANEIHIPVGRTVNLTLEAGDVIHSVWLPSLHGKKDQIPGRTNTLTLRADRPGTYRGQCAEFCGYAHAKMVLFVIADPPDQYARWLDHNRSPAPPPANAANARGQRIFMQSTCAMCHAIAGTDANGQRGPDLTHFASRATIAAGTLPNNATTLAAWIQDPPGIKPGAHMPPHALRGDDLAALVAYLRTLL